MTGDAEPGRRVYVYRNLRTGHFSIAAVAGTAGRGRLIAHAQTVLLADAQFVVSAAGRERVRRRRQREVHAGAVGTRLAPDADHVGSWERVTYNPYLHDGFVLRSDSTPVNTASYVLMRGGKCFASAPNTQSQL